MKKTGLTIITLFVLSQIDLADERIQYKFFMLEPQLEIYLVELLKLYFFFDYISLLQKSQLNWFL